MKRKAHALIILGCFAIFVTSFVNFSLAKTVKEKKSESKVDLNVDKPKGKELESMMRKQMNEYLFQNEY